MEITKLWKYRSIEKVLCSFGLDKHLSFVLCETFEERQGWVEINKNTQTLKDNCKNQFKAMCVLKYFYDSANVSREPDPYIRMNMKTEQARKSLSALAENVYVVAAEEGKQDFVKQGIKKVEIFITEASGKENRNQDDA